MTSSTTCWVWGSILFGEKKAIKLLKKRSTEIDPRTCYRATGDLQLTIGLSTPIFKSSDVDISKRIASRGRKKWRRAWTGAYYWFAAWRFRSDLLFEDNKFDCSHRFIWSQELENLEKRFCQICIEVILKPGGRQLILELAKPTFATPNEAGLYSF